MIAGSATADSTAEFAKSGRALVENYNQFAGLALSNVGIGTYLGNPDSPTDLMVAKAVTASVKAGINVIDTAINYRGQKAERSAASAIAELASDGVPRESLFVCTKNGYVTNDADASEDFWTYIQRNLIATGVIKSGDISSQYHCMTVPYLEDQLSRSLANLNLECIDLLYLHNPAEGQLADMTKDAFLGMMRGAFELYERKRSEGVIKYYGLATWECFRTASDNAMYLSLEDIVNMAKKIGGADHGFRFVQAPYNMYLDQILMQKNQRCGGKEVSFLDAALECGIGVFSSVPFMQGQLLAQNAMPEFGSLPPPLRALQFIRSTPGILAPLAGHKTESHVLENLAIMKTPPMTRDQFQSQLNSLLGR